MRYELLWISSNDNCAYSNYARNKKELKRMLEYFVNEKGLKFNDNDRYDNIQVSKKIPKANWLILTEQEILNEIATI